MTQNVSTPAQAVREGEVIAGKYRVERVLGVGGMGVVVAAITYSSTQKVAIKFLLPEMLANAGDRRALRPRGPRGGEDQERARRPRHRRGDAGDRRPVHGDGVPRGRRPRGRARSSGAAADRAGGRVRAPGLRGRRGGARARHRPPRSQAREPLLRPAHRRAALDQGARLRHLEDARRERLELAARHADDGHDGLAAVHVAGADALGQGRRCAGQTSGRWG